jgi:hypothetical protein
MPLQVENHIKKKIQVSENHSMIFSKSHPDKVIKMFCASHKSLICKDCALKNHGDHLQNLKIVIFDSVNRFLKGSVTKLLKVAEKI